MKTNNHPANGPLTTERLIHIRDVLQRNLQYSNGGSMDYIIADAVKAIDELLEVRKAEPVAWMVRDIDTGEKVIRPDRSYFEGSCQPLYTAPSAAVVPDEWTIQDAVKFCRETGRQDAGSAMDAWNACRAAMLQGAEHVSNRDELPVIGWLRSDYNSDDKRDPNAPLFMLGRNDPSETWGVKYIPLTGNSPVIPDGWVLVPIEPTEHMIVEGFESEPDEFFSDAEVWDTFDAMSGCQQAAHRARLCWEAMIKTAPKHEFNL